MKHRRSDNDSARGFTLLEVLVASAVLGIALVTLLGLHARNIRLAAESRDRTIAAALATRLAAELRAGGFPEMTTVEGEFSSEDLGDMPTLGRVYGGRGSEAFVWRRVVESINLKNVRRVHIAVARADGGEPLASLDFLVRRGGP